ncbi:hypothetical protein ACTA71_003892 [Dictyostelium dimigraforme]
MLAFKILSLLFLFSLSNAQYSFNVFNKAQGSKCENGTMAELNTCSKDCLTSFLILKSIDKKSFTFTTFNNNQCTGDYNTQTTFDCKLTPQNISQTQYIISCEEQSSKPTPSHSKSSSPSTTSIITTTTTTTTTATSSIKSTNTLINDTPHHSSSSLIAVGLPSSLFLVFACLIFLFGF